MKFFRRDFLRQLASIGGGWPLQRMLPFASLIGGGIAGAPRVQAAGTPTFEEVSAAKSGIRWVHTAGDKPDKPHRSLLNHQHQQLQRRGADAVARGDDDLVAACLLGRAGEYQAVAAGNARFGGAAGGVGPHDCA